MITVRQMQRIPVELLDNFWFVYHVCFSMLDRNGEAIEKQCLINEIELKEIAVDDDFSKFVVFNNEEIIGFVIGSNKLDKIAKISYINPFFIEKKFSIETEEKRLYFCTNICILPEYQNEKVIYLLLKNAINSLFADGKEYKIIMDACDQNKYLGQFVNSFLNKIDYNSSVEEIDHQNYFLFSILKST